MITLPSGKLAAETWPEAVTVALHRAADEGPDSVDEIAEELLRLERLFRAESELLGEDSFLLGIPDLVASRVHDLEVVRSLRLLGVLNLALGRIA